MKQFFKSLLLSIFAVTLFSTVSYAQYNSNESATKSNDEIFTSAAQFPEFPGGVTALMSFINKNIRYPQAAQDNGIQGKVVVQFVVEKDGSVGEVKVARGVDPDLDQEAVRVCKMLTGFTPGRNRDGDPVRVWFTLPVTFKLTSTDDEEEITPEDPNVSGEALKYYQDALNGDAKAQNKLGICYNNGNGVQKSYKRAAYWYQKSANQGYIWAMDNLGWYYEHGNGVDKDYTQAVYWYSKSAEQGCANACNNLGRCYEYEYGVEKDYDQAVYWYRKAAEGGNAYGMNNLGECYYSGNGVEQDYEQAIQLYYKAAKKGIPRAQNNLANCYFDGTVVAQDIEQAIYWYSKAAEQGYSLAMKKLPSAYALIKDYDNMRYWYKKSENINDETISYFDDGCLLSNIADDIYPNKNYLPILQDAAAHENENALLALSCLYAIGKDVERDDNKAVELYRKHLEAQNTPNENAQIGDLYHFLAYNYSDIDFLDEQYDNSRLWLEKAAELGHTDAQYELAGDYAFLEDYENALVWLKKAAANNNSDAMRKIGDCYEKGQGVALDHKAAFQWYKKAADNGDSYSQNLVGEHYLKGDVVSRNEKKAAKYFTMSAENGNQEAKYNLAQCYYEGKGTKKDYKQAAEWFAEVNYIYLSDELYRVPPKTVDELISEAAVGAVDYSRSKEELYELAMQGDADAQCELGELYYKKDDIENAILWLEKAGENDNIFACLDLVNIYCYGNGVERDYNKALYWYKKGHYDEDATIGDMLYDLAENNCILGYNNYLSLLNQAADYGNEDALLGMAALYAIGKDIPRDDNKAVEYYRQYLEAIEESSANATIADVYYDIYNSRSTIIQKSYDGDRTQWLEKAAELGNADAQYEMGNKCYDQEDAIIWYRKAAEQGHAEAQCEMGNYYNYKGDYAQAAQWFTKAAAQDEPEAQYRLATLYSTGNGVKKDKKLANEYYYKSATGFKASAEETLGIE